MIHVRFSMCITVCHDHIYHLSTVEGTCPDCGENAYCSCYTDLECQCDYGFTEVNGSCEGIDLDMLL